MKVSWYKYGNSILFVTSAILVFVAVLQIHFALSLICFVPLFIQLQKGDRVRQTSLIFGITLSLLSFFWMIPGAQRFTGSSIIYGLIVFLICSFVFTLYWLLLLKLFTLLQRPLNNTSGVIINAITAGCLWVVGENSLAFLSTQIPWFLFRSGVSISDNLYAIQPVSLFGISIATFFIVVINYLLAFSITAKRFVFLLIPAGLLVIYLATGFLLFQSFQQQKSSLHPVKVSILTENIPPEMRWNDNNGDALVERLLGLAKDAAAQQPDIALWTESTVPWTYRKDDDFINEVLRITKPKNITHVIGINTDADSAEVYNSVYVLQPDGNVAGQYNKRYLLRFIEQPFGGIIFPFLSSEGYRVAPGKNRIPLQTTYGKAGILICNESTVSSAASDVVNNGAQFLFNMSNDGWFSQTYIARQHFYQARLRAVETRKDMVVNSNDGFSGLIRASGDISSAQQRMEPNAELVTIQPNDYITLVTSFPYIVTILSVAFLLYSGTTSYRQKKIVPGMKIKSRKNKSV